MLFVEPVYPERVAGDLIYCVTYINNDLDLINYSDVYNIYKTWVTNNWLNNRYSNRDADLFSFKLASEMNQIMKLIEYKFVQVPVETLNKYSNNKVYEYSIEELDNIIDLFNLDKRVNIYTTNTDVISYKYKINLLDKTICEELLSYSCFITLLISNSKFNSLLNRYSIIYPEYKWLTHKCCLNISTVKEALNKPSIYHRKNFVINLPKYLFKYFLDDKDIKKYLKYLNEDPAWWFAWSDTNFKEGLTNMEYKTLLAYNYYSQKSYKKLVNDSKKYSKNNRK